MLFPAQHKLEKFRATTISANRVGDGRTPLNLSFVCFTSEMADDYKRHLVSQSNIPAYDWFVLVSKVNRRGSSAGVTMAQSRTSRASSESRTDFFTTVSEITRGYIYTPLSGITNFIPSNERPSSAELVLVFLIKYSTRVNVAARRSSRLSIRKKQLEFFFLS